jgi:hypothetical protein
MGLPGSRSKITLTRTYLPNGQLNSLSAAPARNPAEWVAVKAICDFIEEV